MVRLWSSLMVFCVFIFEICKMETIALPALTVRLKGEPMSLLPHNRQSVNTAGWKCVLPALLTSILDSKGNRTRSLEDYVSYSFIFNF